MFTQFSANLYEKALNADYQLADANNRYISGAAYWAVNKVEMAALVTLHTVDGAHLNFAKLLANDFDIQKNAENYLNRVAQVLNVYVIAGGPPLEFEGMEEYDGQKVFSIFWHLNLTTGEMTAPKGHPKKLFDIHKMVTSAYNEAKAQKVIPFKDYRPQKKPLNSFSEITRRADELRPKAKYRHAYVSYAIVAINALLVALVYFYPSVLYYGASAAAPIIENGEWYRLFTAMFLHFGFLHFISNSFGLLVFGSRLERYIGRGMFTLIYIFSGLTGSAFSLVHKYFFQYNTVSVGASGAVYGIFGAIFAYTRITKRSIESLNWYVMLIFILMGVAMGFATPNIGNAAHIGGLFGGILLGGVYAKFAVKQ